MYGNPKKGGNSREKSVLGDPKHTLRLHAGLQRELAGCAVEKKTIFGLASPFFA